MLLGRAMHVDLQVPDQWVELWLTVPGVHMHGGWFITRRPMLCSSRTIEIVTRVVKWTNDISSLVAWTLTAGDGYYNDSNLVILHRNHFLNVLVENPRVISFLVISLIRFLSFIFFFLYLSLRFSFFPFLLYSTLSHIRSIIIFTHIPLHDPSSSFETRFANR